jgi:hypothetical protein
MNVGWILELLEGLLNPTGNTLFENIMITPIALAAFWIAHHLWNYARTRSIETIVRAA